MARLGPALIVADDPGIAAGAPAAGPGDLDADHGADPGPAPVGAGDPCYLLLTSGTTGPSKWAVHRHGDIPASLATYGRRVLRLRPDDVTYSPAALATSYGLGNLCYFPLGAGACAWIAMMPPTPAAAARACAEGGATVLLGVPTWWARLARHVAEGRVPLTAFASVRLAVSAGEPLPAPVWVAVERHLGLRLVNGLGSSEATNLYLSDRAGAPRPGTVGWVVPGFQVAVVRPDDGRPADEGEFLVRGASVMSGYAGEPEASARALAGGWLHAGDLVRRERDGSHTFLERLGQRLKIGGLWVDPLRVEEVLVADGAVREAAAVGVEDPDGLRRLVALVVTGEAAAAGARRTAPRALPRGPCRARGAEVPRAVNALPALPTSATGKVDRMALAELARASLAGAGTDRAA